MTSTSAAVTFLYPRTATSKFDLDYYLTKHIPTCKSLWEPLGMESIYVVKIDDEKQDYAVQTGLVWKNMGSWEETSSSPSMKQLVDDMKNFTNVTPVVIIGTMVG